MNQILSHKYLIQQMIINNPNVINAMNKSIGIKLLNMKWCVRGKKKVSKIPTI